MSSWVVQRIEVAEKNNICFNIYKMKPIIGVNNPYELVQKAGKRMTKKRKTRRRTKTTRKTRKTMKKH